MPPQNDHAELKRLLEETRDLAKENNKMLHSIRRLGMIEIVLRVIWYAILIGFPLAVYYYVIGPYVSAIGSSYDQFNVNLDQLPGGKWLGMILRRP